MRRGRLAQIDALLRVVEEHNVVSPEVALPWPVIRSAVSLGCPAYAATSGGPACHAALLEMAEGLMLTPISPVSASSNGAHHPSELARAIAQRSPRRSL